MRSLLEFENNKLVFEDEEVPYIPSSILTNNALLDIDVENSDEYAIDVLKNRLKVDYFAKRVVDSYLPVTKPKENNVCKRFDYMFVITYTDYDYLSDEAITYKISIKMTLKRNETLSVTICCKNKNITSIFLLSPSVDNKNILDTLTSNNGDKFIHLINRGFSITPESIKVLKHFNLIDEKEIFILDNYRAISSWMKGVIDTIIHVIDKL